MITEGYSLKAGIWTAKGRRPNNQDSVTFFEPAESDELMKSGCIYIVADGVGGAIKGEQASQYASRGVLYEYYQKPDGSIPERLRQAIRNVGNEINRYALQHNGGMKMATTMVAAVVHGTHLYVANVGDSRAYLIRGETVRQITTDHKVGRNRLTRSVGGEMNVQVDIFNVALLPGDKIILCSDGFHRYYDGNQILDFLVEGNPQTCAQQMVDAAVMAGGADNISVILVEVGETVPLDRIPQTRYLRETAGVMEGRETLADPDMYNEEETSFLPMRFELLKDPRLWIAASVFLVVLMCTVGGLFWLSIKVSDEKKENSTRQAQTNEAIYNTVQAMQNPTGILTSSAPVNLIRNPTVQPLASATVTPTSTVTVTPRPQDVIAEYLKNGYCALKIELHSGKSVLDHIREQVEKWEQKIKSKLHLEQFDIPLEYYILLDTSNKPQKYQNGKYQLFCIENNSISDIAVPLVDSCDKEWDSELPYSIAVPTITEQQCIDVLKGQWEKPQQ